MIRNLMDSHDIDPRFQEPEVRARIAALYLPLVSLVMDVLHQLYDPSLEVRPRSGTMTSGEGGETGQQQGITQNVAMAIAGSSVYGMPAHAAGVPASPTEEYDATPRVSIKHGIDCL